MASTASTGCSCFPCWEGAAHQVTDLEDIDQSAGNWQRVSAIKRDASGVERHGKYHYILDAKTGDLYLDEAKSVVAMKSWGIFMASLVYAGVVMVANVINTALEVAKIACRVLSEFGETWKNVGAFDAILSVVFAMVWEMPKSVAVNIWRIVRAPLFAVGVMFAAAWGVFSPYEGRKMIGKIEKEWHDGLTFKDDFRMGKDEKFLCKMDDCKKYSNDCGTCFTEIKAGKVFFLGWCMQVRGNIDAKVGDVAKFTLTNP